MSDRTQESFNVYSRAAAQATGGVKLAYDRIDFVNGLGSYNTSTYQYTTGKAGRYLLGHAHKKRNNTNTGGVALVLIRDGVEYYIDFCVYRDSTTASGATISSTIMYDLKAGDVLFCRCLFGLAITNNTAYTGTDIKNSFWGVRLDWN
jgi:hypothetical protein